MFPKKGLTPIERKKQILLARNDRLRGECAELCSAVTHRTEAIEKGVGWLQWVSPMSSLLSFIGAAYVRRNPEVARGKRGLAPWLALLSRGAPTVDEDPERLR